MIFDKKPRILQIGTLKRQIRICSAEHVHAPQCKSICTPVHVQAGSLPPARAPEPGPGCWQSGTRGLPGSPRGRPAGRPASRPAGQPGSRPTDQPSCQPAGRPSYQPVSKPAGWPSSRLAGQATMYVGSTPCMWAAHHVWAPHHVSGIRYPGIQISRYPDIQISRYLQISRCPDVQMSRYPDIQISRYQIPDIRYQKKDAEIQKLVFPQS